IAGVVARAGLPLAVPFPGGRVAGSCLAVCLRERSTPWWFKPLIAGVMGDVVPATVLRRTTRGEFSVGWHTGSRRARGHVAVLLGDPILGRLGLAGVGALREVRPGLCPCTLEPVALDRALVCEGWLRRLPPAALSAAVGASR